MRVDVILSFKEKQGNRPEHLNSLEKRVAQVGLEPTTHCLLGRCSTTELRGSSMYKL